MNNAPKLNQHSKAPAITSGPEAHAQIAERFHDRLVEFAGQAVTDTVEINQVIRHAIESLVEEIRSSTDFSWDLVECRLLMHCANALADHLQNQSAEDQANRSQGNEVDASLDRVDRIIADYMQRVDNGESISQQQLYAKHPEFEEDLRAYFSAENAIVFPATFDTPNLISQATQRSGLRVRCPNCATKVEIDPDASIAEITCHSCGSKLNIVDHDSGSSKYSKHRMIGHFQLVKRLGSGGFGTVWHAFDGELDREVAIKIPRYGMLSADETDKFVREARAAAQLRHQNIVGVHEIGREDDVVYIVSDLVIGQTLDQWINNYKPTFRESVEVCIKMANALHHAHQQGVIHRDVKPSNIMIDERNEPHLMDFGLARREAGELTVTMDGQVLGTPMFMSPEQARGEAHSADRRTDIYSLGVMLYELLTGELPFRGNVRMMIHQILHEEPEPPRNLNAHIPRDLEVIALRCLEKKETRRFQTAEELAADLQRFLDDEPIKSRPASSLEKSWRWCRKRPRTFSAIASVLVISLAAFFVARWQIMKNEASRFVDNLISAETKNLNWMLGELGEHKGLVEDKLSNIYKNPPADVPNAKLHAAIALLRQEGSVFEYLKEQLVTVDPEQFETVRDSLKPYSDRIIDGYWKRVEKTDAKESEKIRVVCALASFDRFNKRWSNPTFSKSTATLLSHLPPSEIVYWREPLSDVKQHLQQPLKEIVANNQNDSAKRQMALDVLLYFQQDDPNELFDLIAEANDLQFPRVFTLVDNHIEAMNELALSELNKQLPNRASEEEKDRYARRQVNSAILLYRLGNTDALWPLLDHSKDPRARTLAIHSLAPLGASPLPLFEQYEIEKDPSIRQAIVLSLGEYDLQLISNDPLADFVGQLAHDFEHHPDPGLHSSVRWLLNEWDRTAIVESIEKQLPSGEAGLQKALGDEKRWYINNQGQTYAIVEAASFRMGSPQDEPNRQDYEVPHIREINRRFAISTTEISRGQIRKLIKGFSHSQDNFYPTDDCAIGGLTWYEAAEYCNRLSESEGIPQDQWCYVPNARGKYAEGMTIRKDYLELSGYRLPQESEWEFACRAGTETARYFGSGLEYLNNYEWHLLNSENQTHRVGILKPNENGLFDMFGNVREWCHQEMHSYNAIDNALTNLGIPSFGKRNLASIAGFKVPDFVDFKNPYEQQYRSVRGAAFNHSPLDFRSAVRSGHSIGDVGRDYRNGVRPVRTIK